MRRKLYRVFLRDGNVVLTNEKRFYSDNEVKYITEMFEKTMKQQSPTLYLNITQLGDEEYETA